MEQRLILDRYRPLYEIGEGGHGTVVLAYDTRMARRVAIKRMLIPLDEHGGVRSRRGLQEARMAAMLNHPNIVTVHEWDTDEDEAFLIMEYVDGASLADALDHAEGPLGLDAAAALLEGIADALSFAHGNGVFHLDLKPDNVLITRDGRVKVADFGVAALTSHGGMADGMGGGTFGYMPLEQLVGDPLDQRADVWALGSLIYEVLTFTNPFSADEIEDAILRIEFMDVPSPSDAERSLPAGIDEPLMQALEAHRSARFEDVEGFRDELLPHLGDPEIGRSALAVIAEGLHEQPDEAFWGLGLWDRLAWRGPILRRAFASIASAWLVWLGVSSIDVTWAARAGATALAAVVAAMAPGLGLALGLMGVTVAVVGSSGPEAGALTGIMCVGYWWFAGRRGRGYAFMPAVSPLLAWLKSGFAAPLLLGFSYTPAIAGLAAAVSAIACMTASAATGSSAPYLTITTSGIVSPFVVTDAVTAFSTVMRTPGVWVAIGAWVAAAAGSSVACAFATRRAAIGGTLFGAGCLALGYITWSVLDPSLSMAQPQVVLHMAGSLILMSLVIAAGPPARGEA